MYSISHTVTVTTEIQKSKFICKIIPLTKIEEIPNYLKNIETEYKDATHYCYGYIFDQIKRFSDDGEPNGTAGMPILNVLEHLELNRVLAVVIRYFGGIKLGAGGLVRAYTNSVTNALKEAKIITLIEGKIIEITFPYDQEKKLFSLISPYPILEKKYEEKITYQLYLPNYYLEKIKDFSYQIIQENVLGEEKNA